MTFSNAPCPLYSLPNELLLQILTPFPTLDLLPIAPTSHRIHSLILRILHNRLTIAANLRDHTLLLECYHPSEKLTEPPLYCNYLGTAGLEEYSRTLDEIGPDVGHRLRSLKSLYSTFLPHRNGPPGVVKKLERRPWPPGDIPGSRTHPDTPRSNPDFQGHFKLDRNFDDEERVRRLIHLDAHELFSQRCAQISLIRHTSGRGLVQFVEVEDGVLRIWRDWLGRMAGGESVSANKGKGKERIDADEMLGNLSVHDRLRVEEDGDDLVLWVTPAQNVGMRFKVRERHFRRDNPILVRSDEEVAVTYEIQYEELRIRTSHLLLSIEKSLLKNEVPSGKAVVFGSLR